MGPSQDGEGGVTKMDTTSRASRIRYIDLAGWFKPVGWYQLPGDYGGFYGEDSPEARAADQLPARGKNHAAYGSRWRVHRDGAPHYDGGDWEPSNSWDMNKVVRPSRDPATSVRICVTVYGTWTYRRGHGRTCVPREFTAELACAGQRVRVPGTRSCRSIADAQRKALEIDIDGLVAELLRKVYSIQNANGLHRRIDGVWEPFVTLFGLYDTLRMPSGEYLVTKLDQNALGARVLGEYTLHVEHGSLSCGGAPIESARREMDHWIRWPSAADGVRQTMPSGAEAARSLDA